MEVTLGLMSAVYPWSSLWSLTSEYETKKTSQRKCLGGDERAVGFN